MIFSALVPEPEAKITSFLEVMGFGGFNMGILTTNKGKNKGFN